jgi:RHS repeat-associated protein
VAEHVQAESGSKTQPDASFRVEAPQLTLPKGGGALRAIAEKFGLNPVTGTGSITVPIATSAGRGGFAPQLSITYDSGAGNGPFGFGWSLAINGISRKTDKGLPQYAGDDESDVFILSGAEDLVPSLVEAGGAWTRDVVTRTVYGHQYVIHRYRPRVEGLFARIERWRNTVDSRDTFWRSISKDNITTWYGRTSDSRIADPADPSRVFTWQICETYDAHGNVTVYQYKAEDSAGVDVAAAHERNRSALTRSAKRYLKHIFYGNRTPYFPDLTQPAPAALPTDWCFQIVFDYGEHSLTHPTPQDPGQWTCRLDPYSTYRPAFEVRGYRLCRRVLMFHHFAGEPNVGVNCLVRSTDFAYSQPSADPTESFYSFLRSVTHTGYRRDGVGGYVAASLPPLEFEFSTATIDETVHEVDETSLENLPNGADGTQYRWVDLDGEGLQGLLSEQGGTWFYKSNLSAANQRIVDGEEVTLPRFEPIALVAQQPSVAALRGGGQRLMDLSGDGQLDVVDFGRAMPGFFERMPDGTWDPFQPFRSLPNVDWNNPNLRFLDLTGDGLPDLLITEDDAFHWHASLGEAGFDREQRVAQPLDDEKGPRVLFSDGTESIFVADMSGDGLVDLVRVRNGEVCYWPNLGYGRFGAKIVMDGSPRFDREELFDGHRIHLADIDGTGTSDILYFASRGAVDLYFNQSGNGYGARRTLTHFPSVDTASSATVVDLLGSGTACLVWSSPLPGHVRRPMRYIDLMGGQKPHLLVCVRNNMGAETVVQYAPSTKFYVADKLAGTPWVTRLPFPVHVVEQLQTYDYVNRNLFVSRYAYHHGYFDGVEREFRGFGRVDQWDTEQFATLAGSTEFPAPVNLDAASHAPPVRTITWFHTGAFFDKGRISKFLEHEYYSEGDASDELPGLTDTQREAMLLDDTVLPTTVLLPNGARLPHDFTGDELREACRALRGSILRQEIYGFDGTNSSDRPYTASERNYTIEALQPHGPNRLGVFVVHPRESVEFQYERALYKVSGETVTDPSAPPPARSVCDPRVMHSFVLDVDPFGNVLRSATVGYGRRYRDPDLSAADQLKQRRLLATYVENTFTNAVLLLDDTYRGPATAQTSSYELLQVAPAASLPNITNLFGFDELRTAIASAADGAHDIAFEDLHLSGLTPGEPYRRLLTSARTYFRPDDMGAAAGDPRALLPLGTLEPMALPGMGYQLGFTPALIAQAFQRGGAALLPAPATVLASTAGDGGGYVDLDGDGRFWIPSGRAFFLPGAPASPAELTLARASFFLPRRFEDPFGTATIVDYDAPHNLLVVRTTDATGNAIAASNDYRVLAPTLVTDANANRAAATFDALGLVVATAVMGKAGDRVGDLPTGFSPELSQAQTDALHDATDLVTLVAPLLGNATTRIVYDINRFFRTRSAAPTDPTQWLPAFSAILARETHVSDLAPGAQSTIRISFGYSDGFGREIQQKVQAEPGPVIDHGPIVNPRWVGSGWTVFNNKGKAVASTSRSSASCPKATSSNSRPSSASARSSATTRYSAPSSRSIRTTRTRRSCSIRGARRAGTATTRFSMTYRRRIPTSAIFSSGFRFRRIRRRGESSAAGGLGADEQAAATRTAAHANTPSLAYFDTLGRTFVTVADNGAAGTFATHLELDLQNNQRSITDPLGRTLMAFDYNMVGQRVHQASMDAGERWILNDVLGKTIRGWDTRGHNVRSEYDALRRPLALFVLGTDAANSDPRTLAGEVLFDQIVYGEGQPNDQTLNIRTRVFQHRDTAGIVSNVVTDPDSGNDIGFDFKGNALGNSRQFVRDCTPLPDWSQPAPALLPEIYVSTARYDALNRVISARAPDGSVTHPTFNIASLLERLDINLRGAATATPFVGNIDYDSRGRRKSIDYGSALNPSASTAYTYDPLTFRLTNVTTRRPGFPGPQQLAQDLSYTFDPTGNITHVTDGAQQTIYFNNRIVEPSTDYTYDAVYRLAVASGREHLGLSGLTADAPRPSSYDDVPRVHLAHPGDGNAMGTYREQYQYDNAGNLLSVVHAGTNPAHPGWTRSYTYNEASLLEPARFGNRLTSTSVSGSVVLTEPYSYDVHGNTTRMPQLQATSWDYKDQLVMTRRQAVNASDADGALHQGERTYYVYNAAGERVRKVTESSAGVKTKEHFYLGVVEVYREYDAGGHTTTERQTLHVTDDKRRVALVETTIGGASAIRFQFENQVGTACLELDETGALITYEEYYPYGSTSYQAGRGAAETSLKRFRYTAKERDEETGLYYHGARYYAPWIARWLNADPAGLHGGINLYTYCRGNPVSRCDPNGMQDETTTAVGVSVDSHGLTLGLFLVPGRDDRVVAFGRAGSGFMDRAERNTGLFSINIQDEITLRRLLSLGRGTPNGFSPGGFFPSGQGPGFTTPEGGWAFRSFQDPARPGGLSPMFSGVMAQEALEGNVAGTVHFDMRGVDLTLPLRPDTQPGMSLDDFHSSSEARQGIAHLASTEPGERNVTVMIQHEEGVSTIRPDANAVEGDPLPPRLADRVPNISNRPNPPSSPPPASGDTGATRGTGTTGGTGPRGGTGTTGGTGRTSGSTGRGSGSSGGGFSPRAFGQSALGGLGRVVPGVAEGEMALMGAAGLAAGNLATVGLVAPLMTAAEALPVAAGVGVVGAGTGHLVRAGLEEAGVSHETASGIGFGAAIATGAALGTVIPGVRNVAGALIGAAVAGAFYLFTL